MPLSLVPMAHLSRDISRVGGLLTFHPSSINALPDAISRQHMGLKGDALLSKACYAHLFLRMTRIHLSYSRPLLMLGLLTISALLLQGFSFPLMVLLSHHAVLPLLFQLFLLQALLGHLVFCPPSHLALNVLLLLAPYFLPLNSHPRHPRSSLPSPPIHYLLSRRFHLDFLQCRAATSLQLTMPHLNCLRRGLVSASARLHIHSVLLVA